MTTDISLQRVKVISSESTVRGVTVKSYGIMYNDVSFDDLSEDKDAVTSLARNIAECNVEPCHIACIVDDFLTMQYGLRNTIL